MSTPIMGMDEITISQSGKYLTHNEAVRLLEAVNFGAQSITTDTPSGLTPSNGQLWILPTLGSPSGDWTAYAANDVLIYDSGAWFGFTPWAGLKLWVNDLKQHAVFDGSNWLVAYDNRGPLKAEDRDLSTLPTSPIPVSGTVYILGTGSPQQFPPNTIAIADGAGNWATFTPTEGDIIYIKDEKVFSSYDTASPLGWTTGTGI